MLTSKEIKRQIDLGNITIENLAPNALDKPNSCDLRIGNTMYAFDYDIIDSRKSHDYLNEVLNNSPNPGTIPNKSTIDEIVFSLQELFHR